METLRWEDLAGAVLLVSPEVKGSTMIRQVEAPEILDRFCRGGGFTFEPVLIDLSYEQVDRIIGRPGQLTLIDSRSGTDR